MNRVILILTITFMFVLSINAWPGGPSKISLDPPGGWLLLERANYRVYKGPKRDGFSPNITIVEVDFAGSEGEFLESNYAFVRKAFPSYRKVSQAEFHASNGLIAVRMDGTLDLNSARLFQSAYLFHEGNRWFVLTASMLEKDSGSLRPIIEKCMKTVSIR
jgi:hypothetical protein